MTTTVKTDQQPPSADGGATNQAAAHRAPSGTLGAGPTPRAAGSVPAVAILVGVLLVALGAVFIREALVVLGWVSGQLWIGSALRHLGLLSPEPWMLVVSVALLVLALLLLWVAVRPRPRRSLPVVSETGVFVRTRDLEKLLERAAEDTDGVVSAHADVTGRGRVTVQAQVTGEGDDTQPVTAALRESLDAVLWGLESHPKVTVRTRMVRP